MKTWFKRLRRYWREWKKGWVRGPSCCKVKKGFRYWGCGYPLLGIRM